MGKIAIFRSCEAKSNLARRGRPSRRTRGSTSERWRPATDGTCTKSSVGRDHPTGRFRSGTKGLASLRSLKAPSHIDRMPGMGCSTPARCCSENNGWCFECGHEHGRGDRCISLNVREDLFGEIAAVAGSSSGFRFSAPSLPPSPKALPVVSLMEALSLRTPALRREELVLGLVERVVATIADQNHNATAPAAREARRVVDAIRLIESDAARPIRLQDLAATARMSKYHFLRVFRRLTGVTPYQFLLSARMRRAALELKLVPPAGAGHRPRQRLRRSLHLQPPLPRRVRRNADAIPRLVALRRAQSH